MKNKYLSTLSFILLLSIFFLISCSKKDGSDQNANPALAINSVSVSQGPFNTSVVISGTGFSPEAASDKVFFNGKAATVSSASSTQITVKVPVGAGTGNITLTVNSTTVTGPVFTYQFTATVTSLAGNISPGSNNGSGSGASFNDPLSLAVDISGNVFVADANNNLIRKITPAGVVTNFAGSGQPGATNGTGTAASFNSPENMVIDANGNLYVADANLIIRKITPAGVVTTFAGSGQSAVVDGSGINASFEAPRGMAIDANGNIYVLDYYVVRKITPAGDVTTVKDGNGTSIAFSGAIGIAVDKLGYLYVSNDEISQSIDKVDPSGNITVLAGSGSKGHTNGNGAAASFNYPAGVVVDASGNVYVADVDNNLIRMITPDGVVSTLAGGATGAFPEIDGVGTAAGFYMPVGITIDASGILYVADSNGNTIRKIVIQ
jgi:sugar lactone lactonase YvrE